MLTEVQFDGLVGPTHNYAGLSSGNVASTTHGGQTSHPKQAALQGLTKMAFVRDLGVEQAFLPPLERPDMAALRAAGFQGDDAACLIDAAETAPHLLARVSSASSMWTANAATITPSTDTADGRLHVTPANLVSKAHRAIEPPQTAASLRAAMPFAVHHAPVSARPELGDEGAANHTRLYSPEGVTHLFVFGADFDDPHGPRPERFVARQSAAASAKIAADHGIEQATVFAQQHPDVIDAGVFHNDVISVGTGNVLLMHEAAFLHTAPLLDELQARLGDTFTPLIVSSDALSVDEAVRTYLFNSQLLELPDGGMALICPEEVRQHDRAAAVVNDWIAADTSLHAVHYLDLRESMHNGGGPACLRLRVPMTAAELEQVHPGLRLTDERLADLRDWVQAWYPDTLDAGDLADPALLTLCRDALDDLTQRCGLGNLYPFQQDR